MRLHFTRLLNFLKNTKIRTENLLILIEISNPSYLKLSQNKKKQKKMQESILHHWKLLRVWWIWLTLKRGMKFAILLVAWVNSFLKQLWKSMNRSLLRTVTLSRKLSFTDMKKKWMRRVQPVAMTWLPSLLKQILWFIFHLCLKIIILFQT